jgi:hypothetical protein
MQSQQPHVRLGTCWGSCAMVAHLMAPLPLLGYAGQDLNRGPAEADCTRGGLLDGEIVEDRPDDGEGLFLG